MNKEKREGYKKNILMCLIAFFITIIMYIFNFRMTNPSRLILLYLGIQICQYLLFRKVNKKELLLLTLVVSLGLILYKSYIYVRFVIVLATYFIILTIYYISKDSSKYKFKKILAVALIIPLAITINYYTRKDKLIQDKGLENCIVEELEKYGYHENLTVSNLKQLHKLYI